MSQSVTAYTLVDITENNMVRIGDANTKQYHQMQNLNVLIQTIGLRTQPFDIQSRLISNALLADYKFGDFVNDNANVWKLTFTVAPDVLWQNADGPFGELEADINNVAITCDLNESVEFAVNVFDSKHIVNLYFDTGF